MPHRRNVRLCSIRHRAIPVVILSLLVCLNSALRSDGEPVSSCPTDCSWTSYEAKTRRNEFFQCSVERLTFYYECPKVETLGTKNVQDRPDPVEDLATEFYLLNTTNANGVVNHQTCLRARFTLDPSTADNVQAITVSLISDNYYNLGEIFCHNYRFSSNLTYCSVLQGNCDHDRKRIFTSGCLCNLLPGGNYVLQVRSFPVDELTETQYDATVRRNILVPDCSIFPLDQHCPKGLSKWEPFYSVSQQGDDYNSVKTCFSLPPENAETFSIFLYKYDPQSLDVYSLYRHGRVNRGSVAKATHSVNGIQYELACVNFTDLQTNVTYLPAVRLDAEDASEIFMMRYLYQAKIFVVDDPCKNRPCGDTAYGICISNGSSHHCICNEGTVFEGGRCERDEEVPKVKNCPSDIQAVAEFGKCSAVVNWDPVEATDNSGYVTVEQTHLQKQRFPVGNTSVRYTFTDNVNNSISCVFLVSVIDKEPPFVSPCPQSIVKTLREGHTHSVVSWEINSRDNCMKVHHNYPLENSGMSFAVGKEMVSVRAWDDAGNSVTCNVNVTIHAAPFNFLRLAIIICCLLLITLIIIGLLWKYRSQLKIFKIIIKGSSPYCIPVSQQAGRETELHDYSSSVAGTLADESASASLFKLEQVPLEIPEDPKERRRIVERDMGNVESDEDVQESDSLVDSHSIQSDRNSIEDISSKV